VNYTMITKIINNMILAMVALVLFTAMCMSAALGYSYNAANASSFKRSSTNCEGDVCHSLICVNENCHRAVSALNSTQQLLNSTKP
jgi:hypothetical protein